MARRGGLACRAWRGVSSPSSCSSHYDTLMTSTPSGVLQTGHLTFPVPLHCRQRPPSGAAAPPPSSPPSLCSRRSVHLRIVNAENLMLTLLPRRQGKLRACRGVPLFTARQSHRKPNKRSSCWLTASKRKLGPMNAHPQVHRPRSFRFALLIQNRTVGSHVLCISTNQ